MTASNALLMILPAVISGYVLYNTVLVQRFWAAQRENERYFRILLLGYLWVHILTFIITFIIKKFAASIPLLNDHEIKNLLIIIFPVIFSIIIRFPIDYLYKRQRRLSKAVKDNYYLNSIFKNRLFESALYENLNSSKLLMVTLNNGKVYIGILTSFKLIPDVDWITLLPFQSGYRDKKDQRVHLITDYFQALSIYKEKQSNPSDTELLLPVSEIISLQNYDLELHQAFNKISADIK